MTPLPTDQFQGRSLVRVGADANTLYLAPESGGRLVQWRFRGENILHWPHTADWQHAADIRGGNPLLFPFIGRHFVDGREGWWRDADGHPRPLALHGFASRLPFEVTLLEADRIEMTLRDTPSTRICYPYRFDFRIRYRLLENGLEATIAVSHRASRHATPRLMPLYAGHHFYFALPHHLRPLASLHLPAARTSHQLPDGRLAIFAPGKPTYRLDDKGLTDCYHVLDEPGPIRFIIPPHPKAPGGRRIRLEVDGTPHPWYAVTTWTQRHSPADFYCIEPWMGLANAIHHGHGLHLLAPGKSMQAVCRIVIEA